MISVDMIGEEIWVRHETYKDCKEQYLWRHFDDNFKILAFIWPRFKLNYNP